MESLPLFVVTVLGILATPGPTNTLLAMSGAINGVRGSLCLVPAEVAGYAISVTLIGLMFGAVASIPAIASTIRLLVAAYLVGLAVKLWRRNAPTENVVDIRPRDVFVTTLLNPKAFIFAIAVIPFQRADAFTHLAAFLVLVGAMGTAWLAVGGIVGQSASGLKRLIPRVGSTLLVLFAGLILVSVCK
jgi:threonine/homoserine/homoserine lactone efflux protein